MDQAVSDYITISQRAHRSTVTPDRYAAFRDVLARAREAFERRGGEWFAVYVMPHGLIRSMTPATLRELTKLADAGEREDNMADPKIRAYVTAARRRYAASRAAHLADPNW